MLHENEEVHFITDSDSILIYIHRRDARVQKQQKQWKQIFTKRTQDYKGHNHFVAQSYYRKYQKNLNERFAVPKIKRNIMVLK